LRYKTMDKLDKIFSLQADLDNHIKQKNALCGAQEFSAEEWIQKKCLALIDETAEVLNEVNYKWWKKPKAVNPDKLHEELIDILHFWVSMCIDAGLSPEKAYQIYADKNAENRLRQDGNSKKEGY